MKTKAFQSNPGNLQQGGALLTVLVMLLMVLIVALFSIRTSITEVTISANQRRAKDAFQAAEAGIDHALEFLEVNKKRISSEWLAAGSERWESCNASTAILNSAPCNHELDAVKRAQLFRYNAGGNLNLPVNSNLINANNVNGQLGYQVRATLCFFDRSLVPPACDATATNAPPLITLVSTGTPDDGSGSATILQTVATIDPFSDAPAAPLMATPNVAASGNVSIVTNPNGAGPGIALTFWSGSDVQLQSGGNSRTCYPQEFFDRVGNNDSVVEQAGVLICDTCSCPTTKADGAITADAVDGIDIIDFDGNFGERPDPPAGSYPADVFEYFFGVPSSEWQSIKRGAEQLADCSTVGPASSGLIWVSGQCDVISDVGSPGAPVLLVAAGGIRINANHKVFGLVFITGVEGQGGTVTFNGGPQFYGGIIADYPIDILNGNYTVIYDENIFTNLQSTGPFGKLPGSWKDF